MTWEETHGALCRALYIVNPVPSRAACSRLRLRGSVVHSLLQLAQPTHARDHALDKPERR